MFNWDYHKNKDIVRSFVLPNKPIINGIWLPGDGCLCINKAAEKGLLNKSKSLLLVERNGCIFNQMRSNAPKFAAIKCTNAKLEQLRLENKIDYAYFDFLGGITRNIAGWLIKEFSPRITKGATIAITQIYATRGSKILPEQDVFLNTPDGTKIREMYGRDNMHIQRVLLLLHRIFHLWHFDIENNLNQDGKIHIYRDRLHKMMVVKLTNFRKPSLNFQPL